jgi:glutaconate CoA-transferase subunit B
VTADQARDATGWRLRIAEALRETEPPQEEELAALRGLQVRSAA